MTTIRELTEYISSGLVPLHVAVELAGELDGRWNEASHVERIALLMKTRWMGLADDDFTIRPIAEIAWELLRNRTLLGLTIRADFANARYRP